MSRFYDADGADRRITTINEYLDVYPDVDDFGVPYEDATVTGGQPSPLVPTRTPGVSPSSTPRACGTQDDSRPAGANGRTA